MIDNLFVVGLRASGILVPRMSDWTHPLISESAGILSPEPPGSSPMIDYLDFKSQNNHLKKEISASAFSKSELRSSPVWISNNSRFKSKALIVPSTWINVSWLSIVLLVHLCMLSSLWHSQFQPIFDCLQACQELSYLIRFFFRSGSLLSLPCLKVLQSSEHSGLHLLRPWKVNKLFGG